MIPTIDCTVWVQALFAEAIRDDLGLIDFVLGDQLPLPPQSLARWQFGVDFFYRCKQAELFEVAAIWDRSELNTLLDMLREQSPFAGGGGWAWIGTYVRATPRLRQMFARFPAANTIDGPPCVEFMDAINALFDENGVGWSKSSLLPIHSQTA